MSTENELWCANFHIKVAVLFLYLWDGDDVGRVLEGGPVVVEVGYGEHDRDGLAPPARHRDARDLEIQFHAL